MTDIAALLDQMTLEEQVSILSGEDFWSLPAIERLGIGKLRVTDGPNGARGGGSLVGGVKSAAFPVGISIGASWNPDLRAGVGRGFGGRGQVEERACVAGTDGEHSAVGHQWAEF